MPASPELIAFIRAHFRSVWTLELLCHLKDNCAAPCTVETLVRALRASNSIITQGLDTLLAGGLVVTERDGGVRYSPASSDLERLVEAAQESYAAKPDAIRRLIVSSSGHGLAKFADSFRLRSD